MYKTKYKCLTCNKEFWDYRSSNRMFCSNSCSSKRKKGETVKRKETICPSCGKKITYLASQKKGKHKFCSMKCKNMFKFKGWAKTLKNSHGYLVVFEPLHPLAFKNGYVLVHRKVWFDAGKELPNKWHIHHVNGDITDNRLENLQAVSPEEHTKHHKSGAIREKKNICTICGTLTGARGGLCWRCYGREWARKKYGRKKRVFAKYKDLENIKNKGTLL